MMQTDHNDRAIVKPRVKMSAKLYNGKFTCQNHPCRFETKSFAVFVRHVESKCVTNA